MEKRMPTDDEIMKFVNVPPEIAALYIGWSPQALRAALRDRSVAFGAASRPNDKSYTYNIMPEALVKYKHGDLPIYNPSELQQRLLDGFDGLIEAKLAGLSKVLGMVMGV